MRHLDARGMSLSLLFSHVGAAIAIPGWDRLARTGEPQCMSPASAR
jgi:hypothetical protein